MLTIKQYQMGLKHYNGYYTGTVDGISGAKTKAAVRSFQGAHGLTVDGVYGLTGTSSSSSSTSTKVDWTKVKYFKKSEF